MERLRGLNWENFVQPKCHTPSKQNAQRCDEMISEMVCSQVLHIRCLLRSLAPTLGHWSPKQPIRVLPGLLQRILTSLLDAIVCMGDVLSKVAWFLFVVIPEVFSPLFSEACLFVGNDTCQNHMQTCRQQHFIYMFFSLFLLGVFPSLHAHGCCNSSFTSHAQAIEP